MILSKRLVAFAFDLFFRQQKQMLQVKTFVKTMLIAYNISQSATQIGMMTLAQSARNQFLLTGNAPSGVPGLVDPVPYDGSNGQNMTE